MKQVLKTRPLSSHEVIWEAICRLNELSHEWSEFDITVAAWTLDAERFGLRGYSQDHPDHKRVYCDLLKLIDNEKKHFPGRRKTCYGWEVLTRARPGVYRLNDLGWKKFGECQAAKRRSA